MIKTLSNYYLYIPWTNPTTNVICTNYTIDLFVWEGSKSAPQTIPDYTITKPNQAGSGGIDKINVSKMVDDFIDFDFTPTQGVALQNANNQVWLKYQVRYSDQPTSNKLITTTLAVKGYGFWQEGENPQLPVNRVLVQGGEFKVSRKSKFVLPIVLDETASLGNVTVQSFPSLQINQTLAASPTLISNALIKNICIDVSLAHPADEFIEIFFNNVLTTLLITDECRYIPVDIAFQNKNGAVEIITFFKTRKESVSFTNEEFESNNINRQFVRYNVNSKTKINLSSGFVDESRNSSFYQLLASERIWLIQGLNKIPINVATKNLEYKTRNNDRLINYVIDFEYAFNDIN
jgi:hypothetical protein